MKRPSPEIAEPKELLFALGAGGAGGAADERRRVRLQVAHEHVDGERASSSGCRFEAPELKATKRPSAEIAGSEELPSPLAPVAPVARLTSVVVFACRSRTNTSVIASVSSGCRFEASDSNATERPSAEIADRMERPFALAPVAPSARLTSVVVFACRSRTNTSRIASVSSGCRFVADESKVTKRPSAEIDGWSGDAVALHAGGAVGAADQRGRVRLQVAHEHVQGRVGVVGVQVRRAGHEGDEAPVGRDRRLRGAVVALGARWRRWRG